jgi:hypothetical protein
MPVNYRAGATIPHSHALIQLIHEARSGTPIHHHDRGARDDGDIATSHAGTPPIQIIAGSALLPLLLIAVSLRTLRSAIRLVSDPRPAGRALLPGHPPPRLGATPTPSN